MRDLLVHAQLVNKDFHSVIAHFPSLQRKLFFAPKPGTGLRTSHHEAVSGSRTVTCREDWELNPLLCEKFPPWFAQDSRSTFLTKIWIENLRQLDWNSSKEKTAAYVRREASWRRMLVTQPPITNLRVVSSTSRLVGTIERTGQICVNTGIKMGLLYDRVEMHMNTRSHASSFVLKWPILDDGKEGFTAEPEEIKHHVELHLNYVVQCVMNTSPAREPWQFHSEGYEQVEIDFQETPMAHY
jgi:hypothetical protein